MGSANLRIVLCLVSLMLVACEPQQQPIAGGLVPPTPTATPALIEPLRYGLGASLLPFNLTTDDLRQTALVDSLTTDTADGYDMVVSSIQQEGWQTAPNTLTLALIVNTNAVPLNDSDLRSLLVDALDARVLVNGTTWQPSKTSSRRPDQTRASLAARGLPDGLELVLAYETDAVLIPLKSLFADINVELTLLPVSADQRDRVIERQQAHLFWVVWGSAAQRQGWIERVGESNVLAMVQIPLYYRAAAAVDISGTSTSGLPLITRK